MSLLPGLSILAMVLAARCLGLLQPLEWKALDFGLRSQPPEPSDPRITIVGITEADIQAIGSYPIPDQTLAALLQKIDTYHPRVIGLDILRDIEQPPGYSELMDTIARFDQLIVADKILPPVVPAPVAARPDQVGFADAILDDDGFLRRSLLGASDVEDQLRFSLSLLLARQYLAKAQFSLENGHHDPMAMRFVLRGGATGTELPRFRSHTGGYVGADDGGIQTLINFRRGERPFTVITYQQVMAGDFSPAMLRDRVVLVGVVAPSVKDIVNSGAISGVNPGLVMGVEVQAHAVSQILSSVLDGRALLQSWPWSGEYAWIVGWGLLGMLLSNLLIKPAPYFLIVGLVGGGLILLSYVGLFLGCWLPLVPTLMVFWLNGLILYPFAQAQYELRSRLADRQQLIERTFQEIHNRPLQTLTLLTRNLAIENETIPAYFQSGLRQLDQEIRAIYDAMQSEALQPSHYLRLDSNQMLTLKQPLHEMLYEVYRYTIERTDFPGFKSITCHIRKFEPMDEAHLSLDLKGQLGRFLEESLCNVGKYAQHSTRLVVLCCQTAGKNVIQVIDNGQGKFDASHVGMGTQQARNLAQRLGGDFERHPHLPHGVCCELSWTARRRGWLRARSI